VKVIRHDGLAQQIDPKGSSQPPKLRFQPLLAVVEALSAHRVVSQEKTPADGSIHDVDDGDFVRRKNLNASQPSHGPLLCLR
jgi:hypothetical protein